VAHLVHHGGEQVGPLGRGSSYGKDEG
jgi:hypothetical protein